MSDQPLFRAQPFLAHGTSNPITVRIFLQFAEILDSGFPQVADREKVKKQLFHLMQDLLHIQDSSAAIAERTRVAIGRLTAPGGIRRDGKVIVLADNPNAEIRRHFEEGLIRAGVAIRRFRKAAGLIAQQEFKKGDSIYKHVKASLEPGDPNLVWIETDNVRLREIMDIRGLVEHDELEVESFDVTDELTAKPQFLPQRFKGENVVSVLDRIAADLAGMMEDTIALLIQQQLPERVFVRQLSELESKLRNGARYTLDIRFSPPVA